MLPTKSIRLNFLIKLSTAMAVLLILFSIILYKYISYDLDKEIKESLFKQARYILATYNNLDQQLKKNHNLISKTLKIDAHIEHIDNSNHRPSYIKRVTEGEKIYIEGFFPYDFSKESYLVLKKDITTQILMQKKILKSIIILTIIMMLIIVIYAYILSGVLLSPIRYFSEKLARMNENMLSSMNLEEIPNEFKPLGRSINQLIAKINSFLKYKKELFIGAAHEMKTPLAVMKSKCQLSLIRKNPTLDECQDALKETISSIDNMNKTVTSILEFGRAEGAQFDKSIEIDIVVFLKNKIDEYRLLAKQEGKDIKYKLTPKSLKLNIQPLLLEQIFRNLIQNALRFSPQGSEIKISTYIHNNKFYIKIRDKGPGVEEELDLFTPFKRSKESPGTGLGLFLVKSAADAICAKVELKNRKDAKGAVATVAIPLS